MFVSVLVIIIHQKSKYVHYKHKQTYIKVFLKASLVFSLTHFVQTELSEAASLWCVACDHT